MGLAVSVLVVFSALGGAVADRIFVIKPLDKLLGERKESWLTRLTEPLKERGVSEESMVVEVAEKNSPSVVTVSVSKSQTFVEPFVFDPFGIFEAPRTKTEQIQRDIGTGFIVDVNGLIVTNKHVVADTTASYKVITKDDTEYEVKNIYRDPISDLAIVKIEPKTDKPLRAVVLGDSSSLKVGQFVIAIGTALGEFRHTITRGVISGLGRGITAGDAFAGQVEQLDGVIQTDAAINPGNSGGPLLSSAGQVIGVNVAVAGNAQNIGFAIPINVVKDSLVNFKETGQFNRPMLGVRYRMLDKDTAVLNELPEGAYVVEVLAGSAAEKAGLAKGDIIVTLDGVKLKEVKGGLAAVIAKKKIGDVLEIGYFRDKETVTVKVSLEEAK